MIFDNKYILVQFLGLKEILTLLIQETVYLRKKCAFLPKNTMKQNIINKHFSSLKSQINV